MNYEILREEGKTYIDSICRDFLDNYLPCKLTKLLNKIIKEPVQQFSTKKHFMDYISNLLCETPLTLTGKEIKLIIENLDKYIQIDSNLLEFFTNLEKKEEEAKKKLEKEKTADNFLKQLRDELNNGNNDEVINELCINLIRSRDLPLIKLTKGMEFQTLFF